MRGGSLPLLAWGTLLAVLLALNWVWTSDAIQVGSFAFAVGVVWGSAVLYAVRSRRESLRRGPPGPELGREAVPTSSLGAVLFGIAVAAILFGFSFGRFLIFFGGGLLIAALGLVALEQRDQRRARRAAVERRSGDRA